LKFTTQTEEPEYSINPNHTLYPPLQELPLVVVMLCILHTRTKKQAKGIVSKTNTHTIVHNDRHKSKPHTISTIKPHHTNIIEGSIRQIHGSHMHS
jgi:hypothetical protein